MLGPALNSAHDAIYHWSGAPGQLFAATALDFLLAWLGMTGLLWCAQGEGRRRASIWLALLLFLPYVALKSWSLYAGVVPARAVSRGLFFVALATYIALLAWWRASFEPRFRRVVALGEAVLLFSALSGSFILLQVLVFSWQARALNVVRLSRPPAVRAEPGGQPRVIWILFDELSFEQVYERRFPGLRLPAFDRLAAGATVFTDVVPAGNLTEDVMPALMTGKPVDSIRATSSGELSVHGGNAGAWQPFDPQHSVFADARSAGLTTAVAGWYNPYCRILATVLDRCTWIDGLPLSNGMSPDGSLWQNTEAPLRYILGRGVPLQILHSLFGVSAVNVWYADLHREDLDSVDLAAGRLLRDPSQRLLFLHLPVPHPPGIYRRRTGTFTNGSSSYIENLALADHCLAQLRSVLERAGQWENSAVVIMGDHSWRTGTWRVDYGWGPEDEAASAGRPFDPRPAYIVKLPGQHEPARMSAPFSALRTRSLLDELLAGKLASPAALDRWARQAP